MMWSVCMVNCSL